MLSVVRNMGWARYLWSDISRMSLSKPFSKYQVLFGTGQLIIWGLRKVCLIIWRSEKIA